MAGWHIPSNDPIPRISKNCWVGVPLRSVKDLYDLSNDNKAVLYKSKWDGSFQIYPAAWLINRQARWVQQQIDLEKLYYCVKKEDF